MKIFSLMPGLTWHWQDGNASNTQCVPIELLGRIHETGSISQAARECGLSYRHTWGLIRDWEKRFDQPLVEMTRGRGSKLSPLGHYLLNMDTRLKRRLADDFAATREEIRRNLPQLLSASNRKLIVHASHDPLLLGLLELLRGQAIGVELHIQGSGESLAAFAAGHADIAGFHCPQGELGQPVWQQWKTQLDPASDMLVRFVQRWQGLIFAKDNPLNIQGLKDLTREDIRFVNRQPGSGTRTTLDLLLAARKISPGSIHGYRQEEFTHAAVAALIASGAADVGMGVGAAARRFGLGFLPLLREDYYLAVRRKSLTSPAIVTLLKLLASQEWKDILSNEADYSGYNDAEQLIDCNAAWGKE